VGGTFPKHYSIFHKMTEKKPGSQNTQTVPPDLEMVQNRKSDQGLQKENEEFQQEDRGKNGEAVKTLGRRSHYRGRKKGLRGGGSQGTQTHTKPGALNVRNVPDILVIG